MSKDLTKKAVEMLLKGATLLGDPCPYCKGVRVMKDGHAFCVSCGREPQTIPEIKDAPKAQPEEKEFSTSVSILEKKLENLSKELEHEKDYGKQREILKSINSLVEIIEKLKK